MGDGKRETGNGRREAGRRETGDGKTGETGDGRREAGRWETGRRETGRCAGESRACQVLHLTVFRKIEKRKEKREKREDDIRSGLLICEENIIFLYDVHPFEPPHNLCNGQHIALTIFHDPV